MKGRVIKGTAFVESLTTQCRIGSGAKERAAYQPITIDIRCEADHGFAVRSDRREDCADYAKMHDIALALTKGGRFRLLETLAHAIAVKILKFDHVESVTVTIRKPHKLAGTKSVGISLTLSKEEA